MEGIPVFSSDKAEKEASNIVKNLNEKYPGREGIFSKDEYDEASREISDRQVALIESLSQLDVPVYLFGGYACEMLLSEGDGDFTGGFKDPHTDIDMIVERKDKTVLEDSLRKLGLDFKEKTLEEEGLPSKLYLKNTKGLEADFALVDVVGETGEVSIPLQLDGKNRRVYFSSGFLDGNTVTLNGKSVRLISVRGLIQSLIFYAQGDMSLLREKDKARAEALCQKFFPGESLESDIFKVRIE